MKQQVFSVTFYMEGTVRQLRTVKKGINTLSTKTVEFGNFMGMNNLKSHEVVNIPRQCTMTRVFGPEFYNTFDPKKGLPSRTWLRNNLGANPKTWVAKWKNLSAEEKCRAHVSDIAHDMNAIDFTVTAQ